MSNRRDFSQHRATDGTEETQQIAASRPVDEAPVALSRSADSGLCGDAVKGKILALRAGGVRSHSQDDLRSLVMLFNQVPGSWDGMVSSYISEAETVQTERKCLQVGVTMGCVPAVSQEFDDDSTMFRMEGVDECESRRLSSDSQSSSLTSSNAKRYSDHITSLGVGSFSTSLMMPPKLQLRSMENSQADNFWPHSLELRGRREEWKINWNVSLMILSPSRSFFVAANEPPHTAKRAHASLVFLDSSAHLHRHAHTPHHIALRSAPTLTSPAGPFQALENHPPK